MAGLIVARAALAVGLGLAGTALFLGYLPMSRTQPTNADGASQALQAWDMLHGNALLHRQFGPPRQRQDFDRLTVLVYDHNLLVGLAAYCYHRTAPSMAECASG